MSTLLSLSGKIDPRTVSVFKTLAVVTTDLNLPFVVVGATARDLVLHHGHGAALRSLTSDVDFAIQIPDWNVFNVLKERLCAEGFQTTSDEQRLICPRNTMVDIVPFGPVADESESIAWPPTGEIVMNVLGFQETCEAAEWVRIDDETVLDIPVATPAGMALLKLVAWTDRAIDKRGRDALDISYLLSNYEVIPSVFEEMYQENNTHMMETYGWDITLAAANLLGRDARRIAEDNTYEMIKRFSNGEVSNRRIEKLIEEMCSYPDDWKYERNEQLLSAFFAGFDVKD